jgi:hypothetical protein
VVSRDQRYRKRARNARFHEYFYGPKDDLAPHRQFIPMSDIELYQMGQGASGHAHTLCLSFSLTLTCVCRPRSAHVAPASALPIGETRKVDETRVIRTEPSMELTQAVLGVSHAESAQGQALLAVNVAGFVSVYVDPRGVCSRATA